MDRSVKTDNPNKKRVRHLDRITVNQESLERLNSWLNQIENQSKGIQVKREELINWLIQIQAEQLTASQLKEIEEKYFDPVKYAKWAYLQVKAAQARGENLRVKISNSPGTLGEVQPKRTYKKRIKFEGPQSFKEIRAADDEAEMEENSIEVGSV